MIDPHLVALVQSLCAEDDDIAEQGIDLIEHDGVAVLVGHVASEERRRLIGHRVGREVGDLPWRNELVVLAMNPPEQVEEIP